MKKYIPYILIALVLVVAVIIFAANYYQSNLVVSSTNPQGSIQTNALADVSTTQLGQIPDSFYQAMAISGGVAKNLDGLSFSPDGTKVALVVKQTGKESVYLNNIPGPWYDYVTLPAFAFSSDSKHYAYSAINGNDSFVVIDGVEQQHYQNATVASIGSSILLSSSGVAGFIVEPNSSLGTNIHEYTVFNGHAGKVYNFIEYMKMSPDGQHIIYYGCQNDNDNNEDDILSQGTGYCSFIIQDLDGTIHEPGGVFYSSGIDESLYHENDTYSPDGQLLAYTTRLGNEDSFNINGVNTFSPPNPKNYTMLNISGTAFSPDSKHVAYIVQGCSQNNPCPDTFGAPTGGIYYTVLDNTTAGAEYNEIQNLTFNNQGQLAYFARTGKQWSFIDGTNTYSLPSDIKSFIFMPIAFSSNNSYLFAYYNTSGNADLILNGKQILQVALADFPDFFGFTPDGKAIYTTIAADTKSMTLTINGGAQYTHDFIMPFFVQLSSIYNSFYQFTNDGKVVYAAIDGKNIYIEADPY